MSSSQDDPREGDGSLLESLPEHIKHPSGSAAGTRGGADDDASDDGSEAARSDETGSEPAGPGHAHEPRKALRARFGVRRPGSRPARAVRPARGVRRAAGSPAGRIRRAGSAVRSAFPASVKGRTILAAVVAVVVAGAVAGTLALRASERDARLRAAPGGVLTLAGAPREVWHVDLPGAVDPRVVPVGDLVAVSANGSVLGLDPATGEERWTVEVLGESAVSGGAGVRCGSSPSAVGSIAVRTPPSSDPLVCVTEGAAKPEVVVIGADGAVERRELEPRGEKAGAAAGDGATAPVYAPLPDGDLAVLTRDDTPLDLGDARVVEDGDGVPSIKGVVASAPGLTVRVEDAATGDVRWERTVAFDPASEGTSCLVWGNDGPELDVVGELAWTADRRLISADTCGIAARLATSDGRPLPADGESHDRSRIPWATDDPELGPVRIPDAAATDTLVRTAGTAVLLTAEGEVEAYDVESGERRWTSDVLGKDAAAVVGSSVFGAYTDGRSAMLVLDGPSTGGGGQLRLVALDLATGELTWDEDQDERYAQVAAIAGHLVQVTGPGVSGLATSG